MLGRIPIDGGTGAETAGASTGSASTGLLPPDSPLYTFDVDLQGWTYNYAKTGTDDAGQPVDPDDLSKVSVMSWNGSVGNPAPGSMRIEIPFTAYDQKADFHRRLDAPMDLSDKVLSLWYRLDSGFSTDPSAPGGLVLYVKTGSTFAVAESLWKNIDASNHGWQQAFFDVKNGINMTVPVSAELDPTQVVEIGFYLHTGGAGDMPDAHLRPLAAIFEIDSIGIRQAE